MKKSLESDYFPVTYEKELADSKTLIEQLESSGWITPNTIIVNCSPDYSSRLAQLINHKLSFLNNNELYETMDLQTPYPNMSQVWNPLDKNYQLFEKYLSDWTRMNIRKDFNYLFVESGKFNGKTLIKVRSAVKSRLEPENFRFACLYQEVDSTFVPDFMAETFDKNTQGNLLFQWENMNNPNWE